MLRDRAGILPTRFVEFRLYLWHNSAVPVFLERFILPVFAAIVIILAVTNPMEFDKTQRITGAIAIIFLAYFVAHTVHRFNESKKAPISSPPITAPSAKHEDSPNSPWRNHIFLSGGVCI
jgi:hypothetical protein